MWSVAAEQENPSVPVVLIVLVIGGTIYAFGYARAVMHRANVDYKRTKEALPVLRKAFWLAWWGAVKVFFWIGVAAFVIGVWLYQDIKN